MRKKGILLLALGLVIAELSARVGEPEDIQLTFVDHLTAGLIEQDVYVETGSEKVMRVTPENKDQYLEQLTYSTNYEVHHDPFGLDHLGPYAKGLPLGFTLNEWLKASGTATYICEDGWGVLKARFHNLRPNATYTLWHFFMSAPPTKPFNGTLDVPLGDHEGTQSVFTTDKNGSAELDITFEQCLQLSNTQLMSGIAVAYHSDGKTYGGLPGPFGKATHVQLFAMLPEAR